MIIVFKVISEVENFFISEHLKSSFHTQIQAHFIAKLFLLNLRSSWLFILLKGQRSQLQNEANV